MTEQEAKRCIQGKLDCMNKCDVFDCKGTDECENCNYCYEQGNFGEQKKAFEMGIKALEKQIAKKIIYREQAYGTPWLCPECEADQIKVEFFCEDGSEPKEKHTYCWKCGQKLDWGMKMQNDLISRSALIKHLTDWRLQEAPYGICDEETETYKTICECIEAVKEQPTAYDVYFTKCGQAHIFVDGTPEENNHEFCPYCGKKIKVVE